MASKNTTFKLGVSLFLVAEIIGLLYLVFLAISEYNPVHQETIGAIFVVPLAIMACVVFTYIIINIIKWKSDN